MLLNIFLIKIFNENFYHKKNKLTIAFKIKRTTPLQKLMDAYIEKMGFVS